MDFIHSTDTSPIPPREYTVWSAAGEGVDCTPIHNESSQYLKLHSYTVGLKCIRDWVRSEQWCSHLFFSWIAHRGLLNGMIC